MSLVPGTGIEPVHRYRREILSLLCLPISPPGLVTILKQDQKIKAPSALLGKTGGGGRDRTGVNGFAGRCITTLLPRHGFVLYRETKTYRHKRNAKTFSTLLMNKKGSLAASFFGNLEREKSLELSTSTLARLRSTN